MIAGTDVTNGKGHIIGFSLHDELSLLVRAGLSPTEAIEAATRKPSRLFGFSDLGTIEGWHARESRAARCKPARGH
ncbi:MAG: amidohydrolase family protein [Acidobacteria bacterium]|nr:amidohydrolase family protein [Acidobacteriota bacterium]MCA1650165.1 amidohydrolase family protein [Acidobacteriota bacterium]